MYRQSFFVGGRFLGQSERSSVLVHGRWYPPESIAYFCQTCGEVWARVVVEGEPFRVWAMCCEKHPIPFRTVVPGSLLMDWDRDFNASLPRPALERELLIHCNWVEQARERSEAPSDVVKRG